MHNVAGLTFIGPDVRCGTAGAWLAQDVLAGRVGQVSSIDGRAAGWQDTVAQNQALKSLAYGRRAVGEPACARIPAGHNETSQVAQSRITYQPVGIVGVIDQLAAIGGDGLPTIPKCPLTTESIYGIIPVHTDCSGGGLWVARSR
jgi:hypothetical protein